MIRPYHFHHPATDIFLVAVSGHHQLVELAEEFVGVEGDRFSDIDELILRLLQAFFRHEGFFVELLAGAQAGIFDPDVDVRAQTGQADEVPGEGVDLHGTAHVKDEDLAAMGVGAGGHDQADGFFDGHEEAYDVGVGHGHGASGLDLAFEDRDHGAVRAEHIAEADGDKFCMNVPEYVPGSILVRSLHADVREHLRDLIRLAFLDLPVK